jgi:hypothetical protein
MSSLLQIQKDIVDTDLVSKGSADEWGQLAFIEREYTQNIIKKNIRLLGIFYPIKKLIIMFYNFLLNWKNNIFKVDIVRDYRIKKVTGINDSGIFINETQDYIENPQNYQLELILNIKKNGNYNNNTRHS